MTKFETKEIILRKLQLFYMTERKMDEILALEEFVEKYLTVNPTDCEVLLAYALFEYDIPIVDVPKSLELIRQILDFDLSNEYAFLIYIYMHYHLYGPCKDQLKRLLAFQSRNLEIQSMIEYAKSWYYEYEEWQYETCLKKSIDFWPFHTNNIIALAKLLAKKNNPSEAKKLFHLALKNVKKIYPVDCSDYDGTNPEEFISNRYKGIYITPQEYEEILKLIRKLG